MREKFFIPLGMPVFADHPPAPNEAGDTYYNSAIKKVLTYDGTKWLTGGSDILAGNGLTQEQQGDKVALHVGPGEGIKVAADAVMLDTEFTDKRYVNADGDAMTGHLVIPVEPVNFNHAASKKYVDDAIVVSGQNSVSAGNGLTGGGRVGANPTLHVGAGWGITVAADAVAVSTAVLDQRYAPVHSHPYAPPHDHPYAPPHDHPYAPPHDHPYASSTHGHSAAQAGIRRGRFNAGSLDSGKAYGPWTVQHGLGSVPAAVFACADQDDLTHSIVTSCGAFDAVNLNITARNVGPNNESVWISWMVIA